MKQIKLTQGFVAFVDDEDFVFLSRYKWFAKVNKDRVYAARTAGNKTKLMHRIILGVVDPLIYVDHIDGNGLNNTRTNIRTCSNAQNQWNTGKWKKGENKFKGINRCRNRFRARISVDGKRYLIGTFDTEEQASEAYELAVKHYRGEFGRTR